MSDTRLQVASSFPNRTAQCAGSISAANSPESLYEKKKRCRWQLFQKDIPNKKARHYPSEWSAYEESRWGRASTMTKCHCHYIMSKLWGRDQSGGLARWQNHWCLWKQLEKIARNVNPPQDPQREVITLPSLVNADAPAGRGCEDVEREGRQLTGHKSRWLSMDRLGLSLK